MDKSSLGDRMKTYEAVPKLYLMRRTPVIIRLDMCHGHTFTRGFERPYDKIFAASMQDTTLQLCKKIQNCVFGYVQSDEISLVLCDYKKIDTAAWFDNQLEKIVSVSASMAACYFNTAFYKRVIGATVIANANNSIPQALGAYVKAYESGAIFDSRAFNLAREEVCNYFIWRQQDATRNSIQALAQSLYNHKEIQGLNCNKLQNKMLTEKDVNWNNLPTVQRRGACVRKDNECNWIIDEEIPIFSQDRPYIEERIVFDS